MNYVKLGRAHWKAMCVCVCCYRFFPSQFSFMNYAIKKRKNCSLDAETHTKLRIMAPRVASSSSLSALLYWRISGQMEMRWVVGISKKLAFIRARILYLDGPLSRDICPFCARSWIIGRHYILVTLPLGKCAQPAAKSIKHSPGA